MHMDIGGANSERGLPAMTNPKPRAWNLDPIDNIRIIPELARRAALAIVAAYPQTTRRSPATCWRSSVCSTSPAHAAK